MIDNRLANFNHKRAEVLKAHLLRDKTYLLERRKRRLRGLLGTVQILIATFAVLAVLKSLMLATNTSDEYARIIAPALTGLDAGHPFARALEPDPLTMTVAAALRPLLSNAQDETLAFDPSIAPPTPQPAP